MLKRTIKREALKSVYLDETKEILIFLPKDGQSLQQNYPLLVLHDGNDYFNLGRIVTQAAQMIHDGKLNPFVMVAVPVDKEKRASEYAPVGNRHPQHMQMVMKELLPLVRERYPVSPDKEDLVIGGSSLGGTASLHIALKYPEQVNNILSQSGAFFGATNEEIMRQDSLAHLHIYQSIGTSETAVPTHLGKLDLLARNREIYRNLEEKKAQVHYVEEDGDHTWGFWQRDLPNALNYFFGPAFKK